MNRLFVAIALSSTTLLTLGCGEKSENHASNNAQAAQAANNAKCEAMRELSSKLPSEPVIELELKQVKKHIIRTNCSGEVISDKVESMVNPIRKQRLTPTSKIDFNVQAVRVFNVETCEQDGAGDLPVYDIPIFGALRSITGGFDGDIDVKFDASPAFFNHHLKDGLNRILVNYYEKCLPDDVGGIRPANTRCADPGGQAIKLFQINMTYREELQPGTTTIPADNCSGTI